MISRIRFGSQTLPRLSSAERQRARKLVNGVAKANTLLTLAEKSVPADEVLALTPTGRWTRKAILEAHKRLVNNARVRKKELHLERSVSTRPVVRELVDSALRRIEKLMPTSTKTCEGRDNQVERLAQKKILSKAYAKLMALRSLYTINSPSQKTAQTELVTRYSEEQKLVAIRPVLKLMRAHGYKGNAQEMLLFFEMLKRVTEQKDKSGSKEAALSPTTIKGIDQGTVLDTSIPTTSHIYTAMKSTGTIRTFGPVRDFMGVPLLTDTINKLKDIDYRLAATTHHLDQQSWDTETKLPTFKPYLSSFINSGHSNPFLPGYTPSTLRLWNRVITTPFIRHRQFMLALPENEA